MAGIRCGENGRSRYGFSSEIVACDDVRVDADNPSCTHIDCLLTNIVSLGEPPYPLHREMICVYVVLTEGRGRGRGQVKFAIVDEMGVEVPIFGSPSYDLDFLKGSPVDVHGFVFRIESCPFPRAGEYALQFSYNEVVLERRPVRLR